MRVFQEAITPKLVEFLARSITRTQIIMKDPLGRELGRKSPCLFGLMYTGHPNNYRTTTH